MAVCWLSARTCRGGACPARGRASVYLSLEGPGSSFSLATRSARDFERSEISAPLRVL
jgi:hypothetical protein